MSDWLDLQFDEAVAYLRNLRPTPKDVFDTYTVEARSLAFTASRVAKLETLQRLLESVQEAVSTGMTIEEFISRFEDEGLTQPHLETIFRTNVETAYGRGRWDLLTDSDISSAIYGWQYHTTLDDRVREAHADLEGQVFATGEADQFFPPWDFNCRCDSSVVTRSEAQELGLTAAQIPESARLAIQETEFASPALGVPYRPDLTGYDPGLISAFATEQERPL